ncbi:MAG: MFS transporter [Bacteroidales bacterium]|nr:MFS transporter [Bacteroidales bacterium]
MKTPNISKAIKFVVLLGLISLFADMVYEGARSINGSFLKVLGANASTVGWVAGIGELIGYGLRMFSGYLADRTKRYWLMVILGYVINLISVPLLALAGMWQVAIIFIIAERVGKAIRNPARDALLSFGTQQMGRGWGYGLHEALDQIGAVTGPLIVSAVLFYQQQDYAMAYSILLIPALVALSILWYCKKLYPLPENLEIKRITVATSGFRSNYWIYVIAIALIAAGYADFPLIAYHFKAQGLANDAVIPIFYAAAMGADALTALILGRLYDRNGIFVMGITFLIALGFAPLVFFGNHIWLWIGMILWGIGMGAQESIVRAEIAGIIPQDKRGLAFGTFNAIYGISWFVGSAIMGLLYDFSLWATVLFSVLSQLIAVLVLFIYRRRKNQTV